MIAIEQQEAGTPAPPPPHSSEDSPTYSRAEAIVFVVQRRNPLRAAYGLVIRFFDRKGRVVRTIRQQSEVSFDKSSHEIALRGVLIAISLVEPELNLTIKCNHKRADDQLHDLADMNDRSWRCSGGTLSRHLLLLQDIYDVKASRANVDFVTLRARKTGPYALAKSLANGVVDAKRG